MTLDTTAPGHPRSALPAAPSWLVIAVLLLGWLCANRPQPLVFAVSDWVKHAASFSHQQRLSDDVRALLAAHLPGDAPATETLAAAPENNSSAIPFAAANCVHSRPEWALEETLTVPVPAQARSPFANVASLRPAEPGADVPHPPPRVGILG